MHNFFLHKNILIFRRFFNSANRLEDNPWESGLGHYAYPETIGREKRIDSIINFRKTEEERK